MGASRPSAPAAAAAARGLQAGLRAAAASARAAGRVPEAAALLAFERTLAGLAAQLELSDCGDQKEEQELALRESLSRPALVAKMRGDELDGEACGTAGGAGAASTRASTRAARCSSSLASARAMAGS